MSHNLPYSLTSNIILFLPKTNNSYYIFTNFRKRYKMLQLLLDKITYSMFLSCWSSNIRELFLSWFQVISFYIDSHEDLFVVRSLATKKPNIFNFSALLEGTLFVIYRLFLYTKCFCWFGWNIWPKNNLSRT